MSKSLCKIILKWRCSGRLGCASFSQVWKCLVRWLKLASRTSQTQWWNLAPPLKIVGHEQAEAIYSQILQFLRCLLVRINGCFQWIRAGSGNGAQSKTTLKQITTDDGDEWPFRKSYTWGLNFATASLWLCVFHYLRLAREHLSSVLSKKRRQRKRPEEGRFNKTTVIFSSCQLSTGTERKNHSLTKCSWQNVKSLL